MEGVVDVTELKEKIVNTGAEVKAQLLFYSTISARVQTYKTQKLKNISIDTGWSEQLHLG